MTLRVDQLAPILQAAIPLEEAVGREFLERQPLESFAAESLGFLGEWSRRILADPICRAYPEFAAFAFWIRPANLRRLAEVRAANSHVILVPRGVALHIAPSNVDTVFLYSFALSLLVGNRNIVRLSGRRSDQVAMILEHLRALFQDSAGQAMAARNRFITYPHSAEVNAHLSSLADVRVLWGGDETVRGFRAIPVPAHAKDIVFPDRFSYCAVEAARYLTADDETCSRLAEQFYNDAYPFDQKACSSPSIVYFVGEETACRAAADRFWRCLNDVLRAKRRAAVPAVEMEQLTFACEQAALGRVLEVRPLRSDGPKVLHFVGDERPAMPGGGMFLERFLDRLEALKAEVRPSDQTLTYFGFDREALAGLARSLRGAGISRVVPIGQALSFSEYWDGYDLVRELGKLVLIA